MGMQEERPVFALPMTKREEEKKKKTTMVERKKVSSDTG